MHRRASRDDVMLHTVLWGAEGKRWSAKLRSGLEKSLKIVRADGANDVANVRGNLPEDSPDARWAVRLDQTSAVEVHKEVESSNEVCPYDGLVDIGNLETPVVSHAVDFECHLAGAKRLDPRTIGRHEGEVRWAVKVRGRWRYNADLGPSINEEVCS